MSSEVSPVGDHTRDLEPHPARTVRPAFARRTRTFADDDERLASFARELDALRKETEAKLGPSDVEYMQAVRSASRILEVAGRTLVHVSLEPVAFGCGVAALWAHKQLELMEIGHTVLHGAYDKLAQDQRLHAATFRWKAPIDEAGWRTAHNIKHHQYTNIAGRDPDLDFGGLRLSPRVPYKRLHRFQPLSNFVTWLGFATGINLHVTGMLDVYLGRGEPPLLKSMGRADIYAAHRAFLGKLLPYYAREYVFFPLLAGPFFWKVLLGNVLSEVARDVYAAAVIYCGHVGARDYSRDEHAKGRARWYVMQVESASNVEVPRLISILCGGLDLQIEHHLFPRMPPNRLREIAPHVRAICETHGVDYRSESWPRSLRKVFRSLRALSSEAAVIA